MNFKALKSIFGVGFVSFSMLLGVSISSAFAMESLDDCPKNDNRFIVDQPGEFSDVDPIELEPDTDESNQNCPADRKSEEFSDVDPIELEPDTDESNQSCPADKKSEKFSDVDPIELDSAEDSGHKACLSENEPKDKQEDMLAFEKCSEEAGLTERLDKRITLEESFINAASNGDLELVRRLLPSVDINCTMCRNHTCGLTALHVAAWEGHQFVVAHLLNMGALIDRGDGDGDTPLHLAALGGHLNVVQLLVTHGAPIDRENNRGLTPLGATSDVVAASSRLHWESAWESAMRSMYLGRCQVIDYLKSLKR